METCTKVLRSIKVSNGDNEALYVPYQVGVCNPMRILAKFISTGKRAM